MGRRGFNPWVRKIPSRRKWQPTPVFLLENPTDRGAWWATVRGVAKESDRTGWLNNNKSHVDGGMVWGGVLGLEWSGVQDAESGESGIGSQASRMPVVRRMDRSLSCPAKIVVKLLKNEATALNPGWYFLRVSQSSGMRLEGVGSPGSENLLCYPLG